jgi:ABC-type dipeptide/oligopeptide/nickel transport system permease component
VLTYFARRSAYTLVILLLSTIGIFYAMRFAGGDPSTTALSPLASEETREAFRERIGLNDPIYQQYFEYMGSLFRGDLGASLVNERPVSDQLKENGKNSLILGFSALALTYLIAIPLGLIAARKRNSWVDQAALGGAAAGMGVPNFWLALLLVWLFALTLGWLPSAGCCTWKHLMLPMIVLAVEGVAVVTRMVRSSTLEQSGHDYVRVLRAKGIPESRVTTQHVFRNALIPVISLTGLRVGQIVGYTLIVEVIFRWPGIGALLVDSVIRRDYPVAQFFSIVLIVFVVLANWAAEIGYGVADPRIRRGARAA